MNEYSNNDSGKIESVWNYPRPPVVEDISQRIKIILNGELIVDSQNAKRVIETGHPPVYYIPLQDIKSGIVRPVFGKTHCEWKGEASYYDVILGEHTAKKAAWFYPAPDPKYLDIKDYVAFYANKMDACFVDDELVKAQAGGFYGGWITSNIIGPFKGSRYPAG